MSTCIPRVPLCVWAEGHRRVRRSLPAYKATSLCAWAEVAIWPACIYVTKRHYLWYSLTVSLDLKHAEATFSPSSIDSLCLQVAQVPTSRDMAIFVSTDDRRQTTRLLYPLLRMRVCGRNKLTVNMYIWSPSLIVETETCSLQDLGMIQPELHI
jgi:hypothetical protein